MANWRGSRTGGFFFRKVTWPDFRVAEDYGHATGGSLEMSALSDVKLNGSLNFDGEPPDPDHLLRVYYGFTDENGEYEERVVATMGVSAADPKVCEGDGIVRKKGRVELTSVLQILKDVELNAPFTVKAGEQVIAKALSLVADNNLPTNCPDPSAYALASDYTFKPEDANVLGIVNKLLDFAGYSSAWVDAYGVVQMTPYVEPTDREAVIEFTDGADSIIHPEMLTESDWGTTPNVVRLSYTTDAECVVAWARNVDPEHRASLPSRGGRERTLAEFVSEVAGNTPAERLEALVKQAEDKLVASSAEIEYAEVECAYMPFEPNDAALVRYAGVDWKGAVTSYRIEIADDSRCKARVRRFARTALKVEKGGEVVWALS